MRRIEESILYGALDAFAWPRGFGKTTLCRMAMLWAISYAHAQYAFLIGANAGKAEDNLDAVKVWMRFLPEYIEDFPEIAKPVIALGGVANRAAGQLCEGQPTLIQWGKSRIVLPRVPKPPNLPGVTGPLAPTSSIVAGVSGLTGDGIRGSLFSYSDGRTIRPDVVLIDDPQTDESANSPSQNASRERLIAGAVLGMAGPGKKITALMPCTVIRQGDLADRLLDRQKHPLWRGERTKMLPSMPDDMDAWEHYFEVYRDGQASDPPDQSSANEYYVDHREALDAGAVVGWDECKGPGDVSAIQYAMHLYCRDPQAFYAEYQNDPQSAVDGEAERLTATQIAEKVNGLARGVVPVGCNRLTMFVDIHKALLYWGVAAWKDDFTGYLIDYNTWPDQRRRYFTLRDARKTLATEYPGTGLQGSIYAGLESLCEKMLAVEWLRDDGTAMRIDRCLIDANWGDSTPVVYQFCRQSPHAAALRPSHGRGITASSRPLNAPGNKRKKGERIGLNWREAHGQDRSVRHIIYDTNFFKSFLYARLAVALGDPGCLSLFGRKPETHRMLAEHVTAEIPVRTEGRGRRVDEWKLKPGGPDNHLLDVLVGNAVAASLEGVSLPSTQAAAPRRRPPRNRKRVTYLEN